MGTFDTDRRRKFAVHRFALILVACLLGCSHRSGATRPAAEPIIKPIELQYGVYLARLDVHITVSPDGLLRSVQTRNKSYGGNDIDPQREEVEVREGRLTSRQMAHLARFFADWDSLSSQPYGGVPDGGDVTVRYGQKTVSGGSDVPQQVTTVRLRLIELAQSLPLARS